MSSATFTSTVTELTPEDGRALFDRVAQRELGVSGAEFLERVDLGSFPHEWSDDAICRLEILLPFVR